MNCKEIQAKLIDWLDGSLDAATATAIREHVETCAECSREARELKELLVTMKNSPMEVPPPVLRESFDTMLQSELNMLTTANIIQEFPAEGQSGQPEGKRAQSDSRSGQTGKTIRQLVTEKKLLSAEQLAKLLDVRAMTKPEPPGAPG